MIIINGNKVEEESFFEGGKIIPDSGFYYGRGVFETILVKGQDPLFLDQHCDRLRRGLATVGINQHVDEEYIIDCLDEFNIADCVLKIIATENNLILTTRQPTYTPLQYEKGFALKLSTMKRNPYSHVTFIKSLNYTDNILEKENAVNEGFDDVLFLNTEDELAEASMSNIFFVKSGIIYTPEVDCGILDGIIRKWVIDNFEVKQGRFSIEDLKGADEAFLTNSVMGIMKVASIAGVKYETYETEGRFSCSIVLKKFEDKID